ncbi:MAG: orotidine-5'-phosphate decarboxylase [Microbacteriaceae bacterium]|nr:orotidine-5'-phosphate decarboxylase [Microbacteriaceae bacterium]
MTFKDRIYALKGNTLCIGIDPDGGTLKALGYDTSADGVLDFSMKVLSAVDSAGVKIVKPQVAFFERFGVAGYAALEQLIAEAARLGLIVIADAKRGDIGSTMAGYAAAWLGDFAFSADAITVSPFLGFDSLTPAFSEAKVRGKGVFVLGITSNPEGFLVQGSINSEGSVAKGIITRAKALSEESGNVGLVIGANADLSRYGISASLLSGIPILAPGVGTQGGTFAGLRKIYLEDTRLLIPSISRAIGTGGVTKIYDNIATFADEWRTLG